MIQSGGKVSGGIDSENWKLKRVGLKGNSGGGSDRKMGQKNMDVQLARGGGQQSSTGVKTGGGALSRALLG